MHTNGNQPNVDFERVLDALGHQFLEMVDNVVKPIEPVNASEFVWLAYREQMGAYFAEREAYLAAAEITFQTLRVAKRGPQHGPGAGVGITAGR